MQTESADQQEIRKSVRKLASAEIPRYQNEKYYNTFPRELFRSFAGLGLTGLSIPEDFGGIAAGPVTTAIVMEEIAAVDLGAAIFLSVHSMVSSIVARFGSKQQKDRFLPALASGEILGAFALTESHAGSDASGLRTQARKEKQGFVLNGSKCWITSAGFAELYVVFAKTDPNKGKDGISAFLIEGNAEGLSAGKPEKKMGGELSPIATLTFENVSVSQDSLIGELNKGYAIALSGLAGGRVNIAACANGVSRSAIEKAVSHLSEREQFGQKLIDFQGLQFMLADMQMQYEAAKLLTRQAAEQLAANPQDPRNRIDPSIAKCFATDAAMKITTDAVQLLGGSGYVREYEVERYMRDAKMLQIVEGTNQIQRSIIARELASNLSGR